MKTAEQWQLGEIAHGGIELGLVRRIQIDALREARELVEKAVAYYQGQTDNAEGDNNVRWVALGKLDMQIRELELR